MDVICADNGDCNIGSKGWRNKNIENKRKGKVAHLLITAVNKVNKI